MMPAGETKHERSNTENSRILTEPSRIKTYEKSELALTIQDRRYPYVSQGGGKLTESGKLYSTGFSQCSAFVIKNPETNLSALLHIADIDFELEHQKILKIFFLSWLDALTIEQPEKTVLKEAISDVCFYKYPKTIRREQIAPKLKSLGIHKIKPKLFAGDTGRYGIDYRLRNSLLSYLGIDLEPTIVFKDYHRHWSILADFDNDVVNIGIQYKNEVFEYDYNTKNK